MKKLIAFLFPILCLSQNYKPIDTADYSKRQELQKVYKVEFETFNKNLEAQFSGKEYRKLKEIYSSSQEDFLWEINKKRYVFSSDLQQYIESLVQEIAIKNKLNITNHHFLISKDVMPNAFSLGFKTISINLGLLDYLENEDQLVSIICHELGHQILNHSEKRILKSVKREFSEDFKEKTHALKEQKYNQNKVAFKMLKEILLKDSEENRKAEMSADSLGYTLYQNTKYAPVEFCKALKTLKELDDDAEKSKDEMLLKKEDYEKIFNLPNLSFKESWLKLEDFSDYNYDLYKEKINKDSLKSHPDLELRINKINALFPKSKIISEIKKSPNPEFEKYNKIANMEAIPNLYYTDEIGYSLYWALFRFKYNPDEEYSKRWIGNCFSKLYKAKKEYQLNKYIEQLNPKEQSKNYFQFLNFLWNLNLDEYQKIATFYSSN